MKTGNILTALGLSALVGGMLFGAIMAPLVFIKLPLEIAGPFIRTVFPWYYGYMIFSAGWAVWGFCCAGRWFRPLCCWLWLVTVWLWAWFIPHLDVLREAGNTVGFNRGHEFPCG